MNTQNKANTPAVSEPGTTLTKLWNTGEVGPLEAQVSMKFDFTYSNKGLLSQIAVSVGSGGSALSIQEAALQAAGEQTAELTEVGSKQTVEKPVESQPKTASAKQFTFKTIRDKASLSIDGTGRDEQPVSGLLTLYLGLNLPDTTDDGGVFFDIHFAKNGIGHQTGIFVTFPTRIADSTKPEAEEPGPLVDLPVPSMDRGEDRWLSNAGTEWVVSDVPPPPMSPLVDLPVPSMDRGEDR